MPERAQNFSGDPGRYPLALVVVQDWVPLGSLEEALRRAFFVEIPTSAETCTEPTS